MSFKTAKTVMTLFLVAAGLICVVALISFESGSTEAFYAIIIAVGLVIASLVVAYIWCFCPYCQKRIIKSVLKLKACPHCGRDFESGKKVMKVKK